MFEKFRDVLSVFEVCEALNIGRNSVLKLLHSGDIKSIKVGRKFLIPKAYLLDYIEKFR